MAKQTELNPRAFGVATGVVKVFFTLVLWLGAGAGWDNTLLDITSTWYFGQGLSFASLVMMSFWGFLAGLAAGTVLALTYNKALEYV